MSKTILSLDAHSFRRKMCFDRILEDNRNVGEVKNCSRSTLEWIASLLLPLHWMLLVHNMALDIVVVVPKGGAPPLHISRSLSLRPNFFLSTKYNVESTLQPMDFRCLRVTRSNLHSILDVVLLKIRRRSK